ncbi:MAG: ATP-dependent sacrificial sulfur transferase LarE [Bacillota bacterium]|jgi:uncharacterized protein
MKAFTEKKDLLKKWLQENNEFILAFSGGVDSGLMAALAQEEGCRVLSVTIESGLLTQEDLENVRSLSQYLNLNWLSLKVDLLKITEVYHNHADRCYFCKKHIYEHLWQIARNTGFNLIADGSNADDLISHRPGNRASAEANIAHPLAAAQLTKAEIRAWAKEIALPVHNRPSKPCLASRLPYNTELKPVILNHIEKGEHLLHSLGFEDCRLRLHGDICRIEITPQQMPHALDQRLELIQALKNLGFRYITLDLEGLRSGSMDI